MTTIFREYFTMCNVLCAGGWGHAGAGAGGGEGAGEAGHGGPGEAGQGDDNNDDEYDDDDDGQVVVGQSLNDDIWHTVSIRRRGNTIEASVDDEESKKGEHCHTDRGSFTI